MATESDLRELLRDPDPEGRPTIDVDAVLARAHRRRRPKVVAAQALGSLAAVGAIVTGVVAIVPPPQTAIMVAEDSGGGDESAAEPGAADADLRWAMDACGEPPIDGASATWSVATTVNGAGTDVTATLTLRNTGDAEVTGVATPWSLTFVRDDVVVGRASLPGGTPGEFVLGAGESFDSTVGAVVESCDPAAPLAPGSYEVRAVVEVLDRVAGEHAEVVYGELAPVELR